MSQVLKDRKMPSQKHFTEMAKSNNGHIKKEMESLVFYSKVKLVLNHEKDKGKS